ncbi:MAG: dTDP-4-amino-4,6-dideoxygalactose transaminase [Clostridium sp.]|nr:dTDP-4-amino-4,6-dideoxygalactose transaminase [Clostridium sp.]
MNIPYNKLYFSGKEIEYIKDAMERQSLSGDGYYTNLVTSSLEKNFNINKVLMTTSATHALEIALMLIDLKPGDEVIMPSFTFPSTANAVMLQGGKPIFAEIKKETLNIDPEDIKNRITPRTKAIIPVHYAGISCDMDEIMSIANRHNLYVIEDAAQGVDSKYKDKFLGTIGHIGCFSFHATKNYISGEGGALAINSEKLSGDSPLSSLINKAEIIRQKGTNRHRFIRGEIDKYSWVDVGSSYLPSDILMAILYAQLEEIDEIRNKREIIYYYYAEKLSKHLDRGIIDSISYIPPYCSSNYHLFYVIFHSETIKNAVVYKLKQRGITALTHFVPLHSSPMGAKLGYSPSDFKKTDKLANCLLRLPLYTSMTLEEASYVIESLEEIIKEL